MYNISIHKIYQPPDRYEKRTCYCMSRAKKRIVKKLLCLCLVISLLTGTTAFAKSNGMNGKKRNQNIRLSPILIWTLNYGIIRIMFGVLSVP